MAEEQARLIVLIGSLSLLVVTSFVLIMVVIFNSNLRRRQRDAFRQLLDAVECEKQRIGRDLHDSVGARLSGLKIGLDSFALPLAGHPVSLEHLKLFKAELSESVESIRSAAHNLCPPSLNQGLSHALSNLCELLSRSGIVDAQVVGILSQPISEVNNLALYRIINELINNTLKHADANEIRIELRETQEQLHILVTDNGRGFDADAMLKSSGGLGLGNVVSRIEVMEGRFKLSSKPGHGCQAEMTFPVEKLINR